MCELAMWKECCLCFVNHFVKGDCYFASLIVVFSFFNIFLEWFFFVEIQGVHNEVEV
jgi:hypothetical protein